VALGVIVVLGAVLAGEGVLRWQELVDPPVFEANPHYGYLMQPNQVVSPRGRPFRINNAGFRGADFAWSKPNGTLRLVFLGDSITYGGGRIEDDALFVNRTATALAGGLRPVEAVNLAAPGWGVQNIAAYVRLKGVPEADAVIWVLPAVDFRRPKTTMEDHDFPFRKPRSRLLYVASAVRRDLRGLGAWPVREETLALNVEAFRRTLELVGDGGTPAVVVAVPMERGYGNLHDALATFGAAAKALSVPFLDMGPVFERRRGERLFFDGVHLSVQGHEVLASAITAFLRERGEWASGDVRRRSRSPSPSR
jgi:lysophospholipase L1-like esterase